MKYTDLSERKFIIFLQIFLILIFATGFLFYTKNPNISLNAQTSGYIKNDNLIRVGISTNDFSQLEYNKAEFSSDGKFIFVDKSTGNQIARDFGKDIFTVAINNSTLTVFKSEKIIAANIIGPIDIKSEQGLPIQVIGVKRRGIQAAYRGEIEVLKASDRRNKLSVVNILPIEDYLKGVVPNEMPVCFGLEAVKAQTIAARDYAIKPRVKTHPQFDICDSVECQAYFGANTENPISNRAIDETKGLVALYNGNVILALYSSTAGGYTENYENAFSDPIKDKFPATPIPYLKGKPDSTDIPLLDNEESAKQFYNSSPKQCFDKESSFFRWTRSWSRDELQAVLNKNLSKYSYSELIDPKFLKNTEIGILKNVEIDQRGVSGKAMSLKIITLNGVWTVKKELLIRRILENSGKSLPSANIVFNNEFDKDGNLVKVVVSGGGLGHGVGLSQYGAGHMGKSGYTFNEILQHYYDGIAIGTVPVFIVSKDTAKPVRQEFFAPDKNAELVIENPDEQKEHFNNFKFELNSNKINLSDYELSKQKVRIKLNKYIINQGNNEIVFYPPKNEEQGKSLKAWIEVYKSNNDK